MWSSVHCFFCLSHPVNGLLIFGKSSLGINVLETSSKSMSRRKTTGIEQAAVSIQAEDLNQIKLLNRQDTFRKQGNNNIGCVKCDCGVAFSVFLQDYKEIS